MCLERNQQQASGLFRGVERLRYDIDAADLARAPQHCVIDSLRRIFAKGTADGDAQFGCESPSRHRKQVLGRRTAWLDEVVLSRTSEVQDLVIAIDHHEGQIKQVQQGIMCQFRQFRRSHRPARWLRRGLSRLRLHDRELQVVRPTWSDASVNAPFLGNRFEQFSLSAHSLRRAQEEVASWLECEVQEGENLSLNLWFEIDEDVAATDQFQPGKGGVGDQVLIRERHCFAHLLGDLPGRFVHPREEAGEPLRGNIGGDFRRIDPSAGNLQRWFIDIVAKICTRQGFCDSD